MSDVFVLIEDRLALLGGTDEGIRPYTGSVVAPGFA